MPSRPNVSRPKTSRPKTSRSNASRSSRATSSPGWTDFWDTKHSIYVNARHETAHFRRIADDIRPYAPERGVMLDYGCGEALSADRIADVVSRLILCEQAPNVRVMLGARFAGNDKIAVRKPEDVAMMPACSMDAIVMHSVTQYLEGRDLDALLTIFRRMLKPGGLLVLGDVIPHTLSAIEDAQALLRFGRQERFFAAALKGLIRTYFSDYRRLRKSLGLTRYDAPEMTAKLEAAGFSVELAPTNIGHNDKRMTFVAHAR